MKQAIRRALTLVLVLCLAALPALSVADTYLPDGEVTHVDFTVSAAVHPEGFPATSVHLSDWASLLQKLDLKASMDALALLDPQSRVYVNGALRLNGKDQIPFVYDGYHSYRYLLSPALGNETLFFQMHNFLEFMLKPYYYMALPTQYLGLLMYPEAAVYLGNSFFTPVRDMMAAAKEDAVAQKAAERDALLEALANAQSMNAAEIDHANARIAELEAALAALAAATPAPTDTPVSTDTPAPTAVPETPAAADATTTTATATDVTATAATDATATDATAAAATSAPADTATPAPTADGAALQAELTTLKDQLATLTDRQAVLDEAAQNSDTMSLAELAAVLPGYAQGEGSETGDEADTAALDVPEGAAVYTVPYERLYELCETLDSVTNDDPELERVYFFFTSLLVESLSSDMVVDTLGRLEDTLDALDPEQSGMTVVETDTGMTCAFGDTTVFTLSTEGGGTDFALTLPTSDSYDIDLSWQWMPGDTGASLNARAALVMEGEDSIALSLIGEGLPREGDVSGNGKLTVAVSGTNLEKQPKAATFAFDWARNAKEKPYALGVTLGWLHPDTQKLALSVDFNGTFTAEDKSVFVEGRYPQNDFFNLNETFLEEYKEKLLKPIALKFLPILLETPAGVINDLYTFADRNDILVSLME